jgi:hypothetical protein
MHDPTDPRKLPPNVTLALLLLAGVAGACIATVILMVAA